MVENPIAGGFYFISDKFYSDFPDPFLMPNKPDEDGQAHDRPCYYAYLDAKTGLYWVIPISSKVEKYQKIAERKTKKYGRCDTILFGNVLGRKSAFLIQNMFPTTEEYFESQYVNSKDGVPVRVDGAFEKEIKKSAQRVIVLVHNGRKGLVFPDVLKIEKKLIEYKEETTAQEAIPMQKIASFQVDHRRFGVGLYISRIDGDIITYDLRMVKPNGGHYVSNPSLHTIEHLVATYAHSSFMGDKVIYAGPMGCRTGFYLLLRDDDKEAAIRLVRECLEFVRNFEGEIPGATEPECGNYLEHDLESAKKDVLPLLERLEGYTIEDLKYPQ